LTKLNPLKKILFPYSTIIFIDCTVGFGASSKNSENSDFGDVNQTEIPDAFCLLEKGQS
jgi:hypothetical protein